LLVLGVVEAADLVGIVIETICGRLRFVIIVSVITGGRLLLGSLSHDVELFACEFHDLLQRLF
jgi:hypothetical protein